jgi:hypothetical protein
MKSGKMKSSRMKSNTTTGMSRHPSKGSTSTKNSDYSK